MCACAHTLRKSLCYSPQPHLVPGFWSLSANLVGSLLLKVCTTPLSQQRCEVMPSRVGQLSSPCEFGSEIPLSLLSMSTVYDLYLYLFTWLKMYLIIELLKEQYLYLHLQTSGSDPFLGLILMWNDTNGNF